MNQMLLAAGVSFAVCAAVFPAYIKWLKSKQIEQYIREEGPQSHAVKARTPTMGGLCFMVVSSVVAAGVLLTAGHRSVVVPLVVVAIAVACGMVGLVDDRAKLQRRSNAGLSARARLIMEFALGLVLALALMFLQVAPDALVVGLPATAAGAPPVLALPEALRLSYIFLVIPFLVAATTNALNLHDGMDGLAGGTSFMIFLVLAAMLAKLGDFAFLLPALRAGGITDISMLAALGELRAAQASALAVVSASVAGAVLAFLLYNRYPARVFMGDTGSLFLGGMMACIVVAGGLTLWFIPLALIYILETLSVMAQVVYFKLTKPYQPDKPVGAVALVWLKLTRRLPGEGKRLFRMAPLHHHFEALAADRSIPEWVVVAYFWLAQLSICAAVLAAFFFLRF